MTDSDNSSSRRLSDAEMRDCFLSSIFQILPYSRSVRFLMMSRSENGSMGVKFFAFFPRNKSVSHETVSFITEHCFLVYDLISVQFSESSTSIQTEPSHRRLM